MGQLRVCVCCVEGGGIVKFVNVDRYGCACVDVEGCDLAALMWYSTKGKNEEQGLKGGESCECLDYAVEIMRRVNHVLVRT